MFRKATTAALVALLASSAPDAEAQQAPPGAQPADVRIRVARFWRGDGQTLVEGMIGVPVRHLENGANTAQVELVVRDSGGQVLHRESWTDTISERLLSVARTRGSTEFTRPVNFAVRPGRYSVSATVVRGNRRDSVQVSVHGFVAAPLISDALVSNRIRTLGANEQVTGAELKKGRFAIESGTRTTIFPTEPSLWYYLELYPVGDAAVNEELVFSVTRAHGGAPLFTTRRTMAVNERGGVDAARLPLQGLPPGDFVLTITAKLGERTEQRAVDFTMGTLQEAPVVVTPAANLSESALLDKYFSTAARDDAAINRVVEALTLASPAESVPVSTNQLSAAAKRRFLARFWSRVPDPKPATAEHEMVEEYIGRVDFVSRAYVEKDIGRAGVRTDRGRIYMKYGAPDAKQLFPITGARAVEVWKYTRNRGLKFAFLDETGFSGFALVHTTDPTEVSLADWAERIRDVEVVRLIVTF
ncbi:MAG: GWxTD domain-containing protein [Longimicrobiales bacterium]